LRKVVQFENRTIGNRLASLNQPVEFAVDASGEFASTLAAAASGEKCGRPNFAFLQPGEEPLALQVTAQPSRDELDGVFLPQGGANHFAISARGGCHNRTNST